MPDAEEVLVRLGLGTDHDVFDLEGPVPGIFYKAATGEPDSSLE